MAWQQEEEDQTPVWQEDGPVFFQTSDGSKVHVKSHEGLHPSTEALIAPCDRVASMIYLGRTFALCGISMLSSQAFNHGFLSQFPDERLCTRCALVVPFEQRTVLFEHAQ